jgi:hypothetical protein
MKSFTQYIMESKSFDSDAFDAKQKAKYGSAMAKAAADALAAAEKRKGSQSSRKRFPWLSNTSTIVAGWWHPTKEGFTFTSGGWHIMHLVNKLSRFAISQEELMKAANEEAKKDHWTKMGIFKHPKSGEWILEKIKGGKIDHSFPIMRLAYDRGWLLVYSGKDMGKWIATIQGTDMRSMKNAVREIEQSAEMKRIEDYTIHTTLMDKDGNEVSRPHLTNKAQRDAYTR